MKKDFFTFLVSRESPPLELGLAVKKDIHLSFRKTSILLRFFFFQILGALFSLTVCPQFGVGFVKGHGIAHYFLQFGDWACATFCGTLFLSSGVIVAMLGMKGEEIWWLWQRYWNRFFLLPAFLWAGFMLLGQASETLVYHSFWMAAGILALSTLLFLRSRVYAGFQMVPSP